MLIILDVEDVYNALAALHQANRRLLMKAVAHGMNPETSALYEAAYEGALNDVAASFGLALSKPVKTLEIQPI